MTDCEHVWNGSPISDAILHHLSPSHPLHRSERTSMPKSWHIQGAAEHQALLWTGPFYSKMFNNFIVLMDKYWKSVQKGADNHPSNPPRRHLPGLQTVRGRCRKLCPIQIRSKVPDFGADPKHLLLKVRKWSKFEILVVWMVKSNRNLLQIAVCTMSNTYIYIYIYSCMYIYTYIHDIRLHICMETHV